MTAPLTVLQISDSHLLATAGLTLLGVDTGATLDAVLRQAMTERKPDALIASGDLAHEPVTDAYRRYRRIVEARFAGPALYLAGNHDLGAPLVGEFGTGATLSLPGWDLIGFDSHLDGRPEALVDDDARATLEARIRASLAANVLLACHHPPLPVGCPWLDKDCIPAGPELIESCAAAARGESSVRALVFGHVHQEVQAAQDDVAVLGTPSTCFQFEPGSQRFSIDRHAVTGQPGYRWLTLHADGTLDTQVRRLRGAPLNIDVHDR
jgi:Icc protein